MADPSGLNAGRPGICPTCRYQFDGGDNDYRLGVSPTGVETRVLTCPKCGTAITFRVHRLAPGKFIITDIKHRKGRR